MAKITLYNETSAKDGTVLGTSFADSPVVVMLTVIDGTFPENTSSHKAKLMVVKNSIEGDANVDSKDEDYFEFPTENGEVMWIDIQSALRTLLGDLSSSINPNRKDEFKDGMKLPLLSYALSISPMWMENGVQIEGSSFILKDGLYAVRGALSDMERYRLGNKGVTDGGSVTLSRKPSSVETVAPGSYRIKCTLPEKSEDVVDGVSVPVQHCATMKKEEVKDTTEGIYIDKVRRMAQFIFVNSLGAPESACAVILESLTHSVEPKIYSRLNEIRRVPVLEHQTFVSPSVGPEVFSMSSGATTKEWAEWWATEFLNARCWWMRVMEEGRDEWWPVTITPSKKDVVVYDRSKPDALSVEFTVTMGFSGTSKSIF